MNETQPLRVSSKIHQRLKEIAARKGLKLQELADQMALVWLSLPEKKAFPKK